MKIDNELMGVLRVACPRERLSVAPSLVGTRGRSAMSKIEKQGKRPCN